MSARERIGQLEMLLARVQARAAEPRASGVAFAAAAPAPVAEPEEVPEAPVAYTDEEAVAAAYDDVEVSSEVVEVDIDIDEPLQAESGAQPVAHPTMPPDELEEVEEEPAHTQPAGAAELAASAPPAPPANEIEEPAPSSSRRPIAGEEAEVSYGEESSPRHTPPPESGKQVAAPSVQPQPRMSSAPPPPPSLEGHTLIGGWREPGLGVPAAGSTTGVRVPAPGPSALETAPTEYHASPPVPQASGTRLSPDVTKPSLPASANVASFQGAAPVAKPVTLGDLLDLTLGL